MNRLKELFWRWVDFYYFVDCLGGFHPKEEA